MQKIMLITVVCFFGIASFGFSQSVHGIVMFSDEPVLNDAGNISLYVSLPNRIVTLKRGENGRWVNASVEKIRYEISAGHVISQTSEYEKADNDDVKYYQRDYRWEDGVLVEVKESSKGSIADSAYKVFRRTLFKYENGRKKSTDIYLADVFKEKYDFEYDKNGNIQSYVNFTLSTFSHKWELSYRNLYSYDDRNRVIKIERYLPGVENEIYVISYGPNTVTTKSPNRELALKYDNRGLLISQHGNYGLNAEYHYECINLSYDGQGRLVNYTSISYNTEDSRQRGSPYDIRHELNY